MAAAEAEVEVMTVERNGADLVFTPSSLSSVGMSGGQKGRIRQRGGGRREGSKRKKNRDRLGKRHYIKKMEKRNVRDSRDAKKKGL